MDFTSYIQSHYSWISKSDAELMELMAKEILIHNLYPYSFSAMTEDTKKNGLFKLYRLDCESNQSNN